MRTDGDGHDKASSLLEILRTPLVTFPSNPANFNISRMSFTYKFFTQYAHFEGKGKEKFNLNLNYKA